MNDKLVEKCLLTGEEMPPKPPNDGYSYYGSFGDEVAEKQLTKAIPIIREAVEKEWATKVFTLLVNLGICNKDATPTPSEVMVAMETVEKERLDRPELRKGIAKKIREKVSICNTCKLLHYEEPFCIDCCGEKADQILALIPDERKKIAKEIKNKLEKIADIEKCDPDTMAYFCDYYSIDVGDWLKFWEDYKLKGEK